MNKKTNNNITDEKIEFSFDAFMYNALNTPKSELMKRLSEEKKQRAINRKKRQ